MKKLFLFLVTCFIGILVFSGCEKENLLETLVERTNKNEFPFTKGELISHLKGVDIIPEEYKGVEIHVAIPSLLTFTDVGEIMIYRAKRKSDNVDNVKLKVSKIKWLIENYVDEGEMADEELLSKFDKKFGTESVGNKSSCDYPNWCSGDVGDIGNDECTLVPGNIIIRWTTNANNPIDRKICAAGPTLVDNPDCDNSYLSILPDHVARNTVGFDFFFSVANEFQPPPPSVNEPDAYLESLWFLFAARGFPINQINGFVTNIENATTGDVTWFLGTRLGHMHRLSIKLAISLGVVKIGGWTTLNLLLLQMEEDSHNLK